MTSARAVERATCPNPDRFPKGRPGERRIPPTECPACGHAFDGLGPPVGGGRPEFIDGSEVIDCLVCCFCGSLLEVVADGVALVSDEDYRNVPPGTIVMLTKTP